MASSGISLPGQSVHSAQTAAPGSREGAQTPAHARLPLGGERAGGRGKKCGSRWITGLSSAAASSGLAWNVLAPEAEGTSGENTNSCLCLEFYARKAWQRNRLLAPDSQRAIKRSYENLCKGSS